MLDIAGKPCLERVIDHLQKFGISEIIIKVHHRSEEVMNYFGDKVMFYYQKELKDENETLKDMAHWLRDDYVLVVNGDTISNVDISKMIILAQGGNCKFMDSENKDTYAGTMLLSPSFWQGNDKFQNYYSSDTYWYDIGSWNGLLKARKFFNEKK